MDEYGVNAGYEKRLDDDDGKGSRIIPSRTYIGRKAAFLEKYPAYAAPLTLFWGLVNISEWGYRCVLTNPQIDLMIADLPHILDCQDDRKTAKEPDEMSIELNRKSLEKFRKKMRDRNQKEKINLEEILK